MKLLKFALLLAIVPLASCAGPGGLLVNQDLKGAQSMATAGGDPAGAKCWAALQLANTAGIVGAFGAIEQLRLVHQAQGACQGVLLIP
ncbi:MAG: hypothetical protein ACYDBH_20340 [Acidobacteriaceae bacterium]